MGPATLEIRNKGVTDCDGRDYGNLRRSGMKELGEAIDWRTPLESAIKETLENEQN